MRRIVTWALSTLTVLVLLFSYHTSRSSVGAGDIQIGASGTSTGASSAGTDAGTDGTYAGRAVPTRYGNVQVQIVVAGGEIVEADVLQIPNRDRRDVQINTVAVPILNSEVVEAQSADIDMVSGATVTSVAYLSSLQVALDEAHR